MARRDARGPRHGAKRCRAHWAHRFAVLDMMSQSNVPWLNPVIVDRTEREAGANLVRGTVNLSNDMSHTLSIGCGKRGRRLFASGRTLRLRQARSSFATTSSNS